MHSSMTPIFLFPAELQVRLFDDFTAVELLKLRAVSRQWKTMMETVGSFRDQLHIFSKAGFNDRQIPKKYRLQLAKRRLPQPNPDHPCEYIRPPRNDLSTDGGLFLVQIFPHIKHASIHLDDFEFLISNSFNWPQILRHWSPTLISLRFNMFYFMNPESIPGYIEMLYSGRRRRNLDRKARLLTSKVKAKQSHFRKLLSSMANLRRLHLLIAPWASSDPAPLPLRPYAEIAQLEELTLGAPKRPDDIEAALRFVGPQLKKLNVCVLPRSKSALEKLSTNVTSLELLGSELTIDFLTSLPHLKALTDLDLTRVNGPLTQTEPNFSALMTALVQLPNLLSVSLNHFLFKYNSARIIPHFRPLIQSPQATYPFPAHPSVRNLRICAGLYSLLGHITYQRMYMEEFSACPALAKAFPGTTRLTIEGPRVREKMPFTEVAWFPQGLGVWVRRFFPEPIEVIYIDRRKEGEHEDDDEDVVPEEAMAMERQIREEWQVLQERLQNLEVALNRMAGEVEGAVEAVRELAEQDEEAP